jgi:hypothetical protein
MMETPHPPQVSVSGRILIEGQLPVSSSASPESTVAQPAPPWWKFWRGAPEKVMAKATVALAVGTAMLAVGTVALAIFSLIQIFDFRDQESRRLRAYVFVTKSDLWDIGSDKHITAMLELKNFGSTPRISIATKGNHRD